MIGASLAEIVSHVKPVTLHRVHWRAVALRFSELHISIVVLFNHLLWEMRDCAIRVAALSLEDAEAAEMPPDEPGPALEAAAPSQLACKQLRAKVGIYFSPERAALREVTYQQGRLQYIGPDLVPYRSARPGHPRAEPQLFGTSPSDSTDGPRRRPLCQGPADAGRLV